MLGDSHPAPAAGASTACSMALLLSVVVVAQGSLAALSVDASECPNCRHPTHSWDTLPVSFHSARTQTDSAGRWTAEDIQTISKFPLVTLEKWQGFQAPVFLWEEDAWVAAAKQIKAASPNTSVVAWMDTMLVYTGWNYPEKELRPKSDINHTLNPDAQAACATGHFRVAEYIEKHPEMLLKNSSGKLAITSFGGCHVYDHRQPAVRQYWKDNCLAIANAGLDGCGADFSAGGPNSMAGNTVENTMAFMDLDKETAVAWRAGRRQMMINTTAALGNGLLIGKDPNELGDHVNAVIEENGCMRRNASVNGLRKLAARRKAAGAVGASWVYQCHAPDFSNTTIAVFLAGASDGDYLTVGGWYDGVDGHWSPDFARPLGKPLADAVYNGTSWLREFESGTKIVFTPHTNAMGKDMGGVGTVDWGTK